MSSYEYVCPCCGAKCQSQSRVETEEDREIWAADYKAFAANHHCAALEEEK